MRKKFKQRILSAILCAAMVFQGVSYDVLASQTSESDYEVQSQESETQTTESEAPETKDDQAQTTSTETEMPSTKAETQTIESEVQETKAETQTAEAEEASSEDTTTEVETETETTIDNISFLSDTETASDEIDFAEAFPDEVFRGVVAKAIGVDVTTKTVTVSQLESVTSLNYRYSPNYDDNKNPDYSNYEDFKPIHSIVGIDKLTKLDTLDLSYNEIDDMVTDIDWSKLRKLTDVRITGNNISELPDLSSSTDLYYLDLGENLLSNSSVTQKNLATKLPSGFFDRPTRPVSASNRRRVIGRGTQRTNGLILEAEDNYYVFQGKNPLYVLPIGYKSALPHSEFKFYVDGNEIDMSYSNELSCYCNTDTKLSIGEHKVWAEATINGTEQTTKEYTFNMVDDDIASPTYQYSVSSTPYTDDEYGDGDTFTDNDFVYYSNPNEISDPENAFIVDASGKVYAKASNIDILRYDDDNYNNDTRYSYFTIDLPLDVFNMSFVRRVDFIPAGDYDIKFILEDGTTLIKSNQIKVFAKTPSIFILSSLSAAWEDDNTISIYMESPNYNEADKDNYTVSLYTEDGNAVKGLTTTVSGGVANSYIELNVTGLKKEEANEKYYIKISHNILGSAQTLDTTYAYSDYFEGNGKLIEIADSNTKYNWTYSIDSNELEVGETATITVSGDNSNNATFNSSDSDVVSITAKDGTATLTAKKVGTATITITVGDTSQTVDVTVVKADVITDINVYVQSDNEAGDTISTLQPYKKLDGVVYANAEVLSDSKNTISFYADAYKTDTKVDTKSLTWSIIPASDSDQNFATVNNEGLVTVKTAGSGMVRVSANDKGGCYTEIRLVVSNYAPSLKETSFTINNTADQIPVQVTTNPANPLKSVKLADSDFVKDNKITASLDSDGTIYLKSGATANAKGTVQIIFTTEDGEYTSGDIDISVNISTDSDVSVDVPINLPAPTFKQIGVLNTFYSSDTNRSTPDAVFTVTSKDYTIEDIELADGNTNFGRIEYDGNTVSLWTKGLVDSVTRNKFNNSVTATLNIKYKDYSGYAPQRVTVKTKYTPIKLAISKANVINGNQTFTVSVTNTSTKQAVGNTVHIDKIIDNSDVEKISDYIGSDGTATLKYTGTKNANYTATFSSSDWTDTVNAKGNITYVSKPKLVFGNKAAIVSSKANISYVSVSLSNANLELDSKNFTFEPTGKNKDDADKYLNINFDSENQCIVATLDESADTKTKATYSYIITYKLGENTQPLTAKFNVNVLASKNNDVKVTFKKKGTINLLNANEYMTLTPTLGNTTAKIDSIEKYTVSSAATKTKPSEDVTDQFSLKKLDSGELKLAYNNNPEVTKKLEAKQKYNVVVTFKLTDGTTTPQITIKDIKPVAKLPSKTTATNTKGTLNLNQDKAFTTNIITTSKTGSNAIKKIEIADTSIKCKDKKAYSATELFDVDSFNPNEYNPSNAAVSIKLTDKAKDLLTSGKKYSVKLYVYYETGATIDSFKPVTLSITVK